MSEPKVQLVDPQGNMSVTGMSAVGVITATSFDGISNSSATGITGTPELNLGIVTATSFVGQGDGHAAGLAGTPELNLGVTTATSFVGDAVGKAAGLTGTPNLNVGLVTATGFTGNVTGTVTGNVTGLAVSITPGSNLGLGVCTAIQYHGDGSTLTGAGSSAYIAQEVTATSGSTTINLNNGNLIYFDSSSNTAISFSNPFAAEQITFIRKATNSYTITWPATVKWKNNVTPTLINNSEGYAKAVQIFHFTTFDTGSSYNAWEEIEYNVGQPNTLFVWGDNDDGTLGQNDRTNRSSPIQVPGNNWSTIITNNIGTFSDIIAKKSDGTLWGWGDNGYGTLGQNNRTEHSSPTQIGTETTWALTCSGPYLTGSTKTDGTLWTWGWNNWGQLGLNDRTEYSSPTQVPGTTWPISTTGADNVNMAMSYSTHVIKQDGTMWMWGNNENGQLGLNNTTDRSSPTQIGTETTWKCVTAGMAKFSAGVKTDGTLWAWGSDGSGALGQNGPVNRRLSSPTQVGTDTTWSRVSQNNKDDFIGAIKTNGTLWMWSKGDRGLTAQNDLVWRSSPTQVGTDTNWKSVTIGDNHAIAVKTNGTLWGWGNNAAGELGLGDKTERSSPTQVPGTNWSSISATSGSTSIATQPYNG